MDFGVFLLFLDFTERHLHDKLAELWLVTVNQMVEVLASLELVEQDGEVLKEWRSVLVEGIKKL
jgi:hypothetical protein